jgi:hypothetical protein
VTVEMREFADFSIYTTCQLSKAISAVH